MTAVKRGNQSGTLQASSLALVTLVGDVRGRRELLQSGQGRVN